MNLSTLERLLSPEEFETELRISGWEGAANCAECCARSRILIGGVEVSAIESVIHFSPELQPGNLSEAPIFLNREIPVFIAGCPEGCNVTWGVSHGEEVSGDLGG